MRLVDYAPATALATLPAVLTHAYAGSLLSSLLALAEGGGAAMPSSPASTALGGLSALGTGLLLRELARGLAADNVKSKSVRVFDPLQTCRRAPSREGAALCAHDACWHSGGWASATARGCSEGSSQRLRALGAASG